MIRILLIACFLSHVATAALGGQVSISDFSTGAHVQDFEAFSGISAGPVQIGADIFDSDDHRLVSGGKLGRTIGRTGVALRNGSSEGNSPIGFIEVTLGNPTFRAGLYVGFQYSWSADVEFYNTQGNLLGTLNFTGDGGDNAFAAWQSDSGLIDRIRVIDNVLDINLIIIDDFIQEIPEPNSALLAVFGALTALAFCFRQASKSFGFELHCVGLLSDEP